MIIRIVKMIPYRDSYAALACSDYLLSKMESQSSQPSVS